MDTPLCLTPSPRQKIWGKTRLSPWFPNSSQPIGEVWFLADRDLPLLVKLIFTSERLSVQVHPDDGEDGPRGKTEMWHILEAEPGASIALGFREPLTRRRLAESARTGEIEGLLNWVPVKAGETYFNGAGRCSTCHSPTGDLKGIGSRLTPAVIQGRLVLPRGGGTYPPSYSSPPDPKEAARTVTITQPSGEQMSGTLIYLTDFIVTLRDGAGIQHTFARAGDVPKVEVVDPLQYHLDHMRRLTDKDMHDLTAYLVTLK